MTEEQPAPARAEGRVVRQEINGGTKVIRVAEGARWSDEAEERFLEELAASCNVRAAAAAAGFSTTAVYKRRMRWPGFAAAWAEAVDQGYARLEAMLVEQATDSLRVLRQTRHERKREDDGRPNVPFAQALNLLRLHRAEVRGGKPQNYRAAEKAPDMDEIRASILRKIEAIERADALKEARPSS
jgi:hypothetical protein